MLRIRALRNAWMTLNKPIPLPSRCPPRPETDSLLICLIKTSPSSATLSGQWVTAED